MTKTEYPKLFSGANIRSVWDDETQQWYFSIVDVVGALTDSTSPQTYWRKLKQRLKAEGNETVTNCHAFKLTAADGKRRLTDVATPEDLFRLIQSIPSPKAEPFKQWMATVAATRIDQAQDPELAIEQAVADYRRLGYSEQWIKQRMRSVEVRNELTAEWQRAGVRQGREYALLTDIITQTWSGRTTRDYKRLKGLKRESLRDNMTNMELALNSLAEATTTEISKNDNPQGFGQSAGVAKRGAGVAKHARQEIEAQLGRPVVSAARASDYLLPPADGGGQLEKE